MAVNIDGTGSISGLDAMNVPVYADAAARNAAIPTPVAGQIVFVTGTGTQVYNGTEWGNTTVLGAPSTVEYLVIAGGGSGGGVVGGGGGAGGYRSSVMGESIQSLSVLDSPNTASAQAYTLGQRVDSGVTLRTTYAGRLSTLILMEVGA